MSELKTIEDYKNEINKINLQIEQLNNSINSLNIEKSALQKNCDFLIREENLKLILNNVNNIQEREVFEYCLETDTPTIQLIDEFLKSKANYLILKTDMNYHASDLGINTDVSFWYGIAYIIRKRYPKTFCKRGYTMSELKKLSKINTKISNCIDELLYKELYTAIRSYFVTRDANGKYIIKENLNLNKDYHNIPFNNIIKLRAQSSKNRTGYGNEYNGETLVHKGTEYGETTEFIIVGVRLFKKYPLCPFDLWNLPI